MPIQIISYNDPPVGFEPEQREWVNIIENRYGHLSRLKFDILAPYKLVIEYPQTYLEKYEPNRKDLPLELTNLEWINFKSFWRSKVENPGVDYFWSYQWCDYIRQFLGLKVIQPHFDYLKREWGIIELLNYPNIHIYGYNTEVPLEILRDVLTDRGLRVDISLKNKSNKILQLDAYLY